MGNSTLEKVIELVVSGESVIPYEKIIDFNNLESKAEDVAFIEQLEFFSELKHPAVGNKESEN